MSDPKFLWRFTPNRTNPETLDATFVQRQALLADAVERIRESATSGNKHHLLFIGPRGIGKTHFVTFVHRRIAEDATLKDRLRVAWLNEDETGTSFLDLLLRILHSLTSAYPDEFPVGGMEELYLLSPDDARRKAAQWLLNRLENRVLLVIVENLDALFAGLGDEGQKQWRAFLQEHSAMTVLATAQKLFEGVSRRASPFFGFFQIEHLQPLSLDEAVELLTKIAKNAGDEQLTEYLQSPEGRARVRALHHLSGGNHRVYIVLSQFIDRQSLDELIGPFEKMLDELTPYYQERLRWLSPQQRKIAEFLCTCSSPAPVKHIAQRLFITNQTAASQLKVLRENGYVLCHASGRESLYELTEPLMRLSYEVKQNGPKPIRLIVDFLRIWYSADELRGRLLHLPANAIREREHILAAIEASFSSDPRTAAILKDIKKAKDDNQIDDAVAALEELAHVRGSYNDWYELGAYKLYLLQSRDAINCFKNATLVDTKDCYAWNSLGVAYLLNNQFRKALSCFRKATQLDPEYSKAWNSYGAALVSLDREFDAIEFFEHALQVEPNNSMPWENLGHYYFRQKAYDKASFFYDKALEIDNDDAILWESRGRTFSKFGDSEQAIICYDKAIDIDPEYSIAWNNRSVDLCILGRFEESLDSINKALQISSDHKSILLYNRAWCLFGIGRWIEGYENLEACCLNEWPEEDCELWGDIDSIIILILQSSSDFHIWRERIDHLIRIFSTARKIKILGEGLITSLRKCKLKIFSPEVFRTWRQLWLDAGKGYPELEFGLKLFDVGMRYLMSNDRRVLLELLSTERSIVCEALGIAEDVNS